ncbi:hypothetical protein RHGRI_016473 [Rhododendron griersonianum]|uniref:Uncharacterized protein n=1 Tax=Rhododendron griersonianum TaxID=479676 RepID=A0AAV6JUJ1_9ERIC|nr:hypothetical protein RHGRI_016473 [Rhododendron griersonianum]
MTEFGARYGGGGGDTDDSIPRGGPIFVPDMVSPLTRVSTFESYVIQELHDLQTCLISDSIEAFEDEISVDELKIVTEEELAVKAIEEVFKDDGSLNASSVRNNNEVIVRRSKRINGKSRDKEVRENCDEGSGVVEERKRINGESCSGENQENEIIERINGKSRDNEVRENCGEGLGVVEERKRINGESCSGENQESCAGNLEVVEKMERINGNSCNGEDRENCDQNLEVVEKRKRINGNSRNGEDQEDYEEKVRIPTKRKRGNNCDVGDQENSAENAEVAKEKKGINGESNNVGDQETCAEKLKSKKRKRMKGSNHIFEDDGSFDAKVEPFLKIKRKQEEEKASARLHSFNGSLQKTNECENKSSDDIERMTSLRSIDGVTKVNTSNYHGDHVPVIYPEVVLCVEVYNNKNQIRMKTQEFLVLGCQFLSELRDKIHCLTDQVMQKAGQHDPSGYFLIEDIFCNDMRDANATNYSGPILEWLRNSKDEAVAKWECILSGFVVKVTGYYYLKGRACFYRLLQGDDLYFDLFTMDTLIFCKAWTRWYLCVSCERDLTSSVMEGVDTLLMYLYRALNRVEDMERLASCLFSSMRVNWGTDSQQSTTNVISGKDIVAIEVSKILEKSSDQDLILQHLGWIADIDQVLAIRVLTSERTDQLSPGRSFSHRLKAYISIIDALDKNPNPSLVAVVAQAAGPQNERLKFILWIFTAGAILLCPLGMSQLPDPISVICIALYRNEPMMVLVFMAKACADQALPPLTAEKPEAATSHAFGYLRGNRLDFCVLCLSRAMVHIKTIKVGV